MQELTPAQQANIQAQIQWQEKEQAIQNNWTRVQSERQQHLDHSRFMVEHVGECVCVVSVVLIVSLLIAYCYRLACANALKQIAMQTTADVQKNQDDNNAVVREARDLLAKRDEATA